MKVFIKYKTDGYSYNQKNLDTDLMYAWNGYVFRQLNSLQEILVCMEQNKPILILDENVGDHVRDEHVDKYILFAINPSSVAMVFPDRSARGAIDEAEKVNKEAELRVGAFPPDVAVRKAKELERVEYRDHVCVPSLNGQECEICNLPNAEQHKECNYIGSTPKDGIVS